MKIVIIENPRPLSIEHYNDVANAPLSASLNSGYALAVARRAGWDVGYLDLSASLQSEQTMAGQIIAQGADVILVHWVYSWGHEATVRTVLARVKREQNVMIGAFGLFPTLSRSRLPEYAPQLDFIIVGEFEQTLDDLLRSRENGDRPMAVPGLAHRETTYAARDVIDDLTWLPVPDDVGANCDYTTMNIAASRGCFGECSFCFISGFYSCSRRRERSVSSLEAEIEARLQRRRIDQLYFIDPTFIGHGATQRDRVAAISGIARSAAIPFGFETRVDTVDKRLFNLLAKNGASSVFLGIESGCDSVLRRINKKTTTRQISRAVHCIQESGIPLTIGFIMFEPDSTMAELAENYDFLENLGLLSDHELTVNLLYHNQIVLYGSESWNRFEKAGRLLLDENLPFEAGYRFKHEAVARVCRTMRLMASGYFQGMERLRGKGIRQVDDAAINGVMKEAFRECIGIAENSSEQYYHHREELFLADLHSLLADSKG